MHLTRPLYLVYNYRLVLYSQGQDIRERERDRDETAYKELKKNRKHGQLISK